MSAPKEIEDLLPGRRHAHGPAEADLVQVSTRVPSELRDAAREAALVLGVSMTELVERALRAEIARATDPAAQFAAQVAESIRRRLAAALADGTWDQAVAAYTATDPDLAS